MAKYRIKLNRKDVKMLWERGYLICTINSDLEIKIVLDKDIKILPEKKQTQTVRPNPADAFFDHIIEDVISHLDLNVEKDKMN